MIGERARTWGSTEAERRLELACDRHMAAYDEALHRAVSVSAPPAVVFRWLCQLRAAPYSYDLLDNFGRRSPRQLTPGLDDLEVGQSVMTVFELVEFEHDCHITLVLRRARRPFGQLAVTYAVLPDEHRAETCRLLVRLLWSYRPGPGEHGGATTVADRRHGDDAAPAAQHQAALRARRSPGALTAA